MQRMMASDNKNNQIHFFTYLSDVAIVVINPSREVIEDHRGFSLSKVMSRQEARAFFLDGLKTLDKLEGK